MAETDANVRDALGQRPARGHFDAWGVLVRVFQQIGRDNVSLIAAGLALYALLATFPALFAVVSVYGLVAMPEQIADQMQSLASLLPTQAAGIIQGALQSIAASHHNTLTLGVVVGLVLSLWSARKGMAALMTATNIAYQEDEQRGFFARVFVSLALTFGAVMAFVLVVLLAVAAPVALNFLGVSEGIRSVLGALQWVILWILIVLVLDVIYRFAPSRRGARWRFLTPGSAIAASTWVVGSVLFSVYVTHFGNYGKTYGTLGGVVILLLWFFLSGFVVLLGAEINAEIERQRGRRTPAH